MCVVALETGGVLGLPKMLIDPRRPEVMSPEARFCDSLLHHVAVSPSVAAQYEPLCDSCNKDSNV